LGVAAEASAGSGRADAGMAAPRVGGRISGSRRLWASKDRGGSSSSSTATRDGSTTVRPQLRRAARCSFWPGYSSRSSPARRMRSTSRLATR